MKSIIWIMLTTIMLTCVGATNEQYPVAKRVTIRDIINAGLDEIGHDRTYVVVRDIPPRLRNYARDNGIYFDAFIVGGDGTYIMYYDKQTPDAMRYRIVAHELIHLQQFESRRLRIISNKSVWWEGEIIPDISKIYYSKRPWEIEAAIQQGQLSIKIRKRLKSNN